MPDSSSRLDGYKKFLSAASVPSTPACFFTASVVLFSYYSVSGFFGRIFALIFLLMFIISAVFVIHRYRKILSGNKFKSAAAVLILLVCSALSYFINSRIKTLICDNDLPEYIDNIEVQIEDTLRKRYSTEIFFELITGRVRRCGGTVYHYGDKSLNAGDRIFIHKRLYKTKMHNGGFASTLAARGIHYTASLTDNDITVIKKSPVPYRGYLQKTLLDRIDKLFVGPSSGVVKALFTGNQNYIEKSIIINYRNSGVLHTLSASGLHVAIFASIPAFFLLPFFRRNTAATVSFITVLLYLYITDTPVSLLRAVIMYGFFFVQTLIFRKSNGFNYLMLTCIVILIISPWEIFNPGFQLSFAATAGILIFYRQFRKSLSPLPSFISDSTAVSLSAQVFSIPIILISMNQINTAGLVTNIIIIPMITVVMGLSLVAVIISPISMNLGVLAAKLTTVILKFSFVFTDYISGLKFNFYIYGIDPALVILILAGFIPLLNLKAAVRMKYYPVVISAILCTVYLKYINNYRIEESGYKIKENHAALDSVNNRHILRLNLKDSIEIQSVITDIKRLNPDIQAIELADSSYNNILVSRILMNDFIIDEVRFNGIPEINSQLGRFASQLEKDNIVLKIADKSD